MMVHKKNEFEDNNSFLKIRYGEGSSLSVFFRKKRVKLISIYLLSKVHFLRIYPD
jgi:hypothetical protein